MVSQSRPSDEQVRQQPTFLSIIFHFFRFNFKAESTPSSDKIFKNRLKHLKKKPKKFKMKLVKLKKMFPLDWNLLHGRRSVRKRLTVRWAADTSRPLSAYSLRAQKKKITRTKETANRFAPLNQKRISLKLFTESLSKKVALHWLNFIISFHVWKNY